MQLNLKVKKETPVFLMRYDRYNIVMDRGVIGMKSLMERVVERLNGQQTGDRYYAYRVVISGNEQFPHGGEFSVMSKDEVGRAVEDVSFGEPNPTSVQFDDINVYAGSDVEALAVSKTKHPRAKFVVAVKQDWEQTADEGPDIGEWEKD